MCRTETPARERYARDIQSLQESLSFRSLAATTDVAYRQVREDGLLTLALRTDQLTHRHLLGMQGFRLAQYLQLGWVCPDAIADRGMFCEPTQSLNDDDLHFVTLDGTGQILGYLGLVASGDAGARAMTDPDRSRFPVEVAHDLDLTGVVPSLRTVTTDQVRELKRFVHRRSMRDPVMRLRVTVELLLATSEVVLGMPHLRTLVGDVEEHVALRHLMVMGLQVRLIDGTRPALSDQHYLHPAYTARAAVLPFVAEVPPADRVRARAQELGALLDAADPLAAIGPLAAACGGELERIAA